MAETTAIQQPARVVTAEGPLHVAFGLAASSDLRREAEARGVTPQVLVSAAINRLLDDAMWDAVFDGDNPLFLAGGHARHLGTDLTLLQCGVLYLLSIHTARDGACHFSAATLMEQLRGSSMQGVRDALSALERRGLIRRVQKLFAGGVQPWRLTKAGLGAAAQLAGLDFSGGEA